MNDRLSATRASPLRFQRYARERLALKCVRYRLQSKIGVPTSIYTCTRFAYNNVCGKMHQRDNRNVRSEMHSRNLAGLCPRTLIVRLRYFRYGRREPLIIFVTIPPVKDYLYPSLCLVARSEKPK